MIASRQNETLKTMRRLRGRQGDHALLEGPHLLREALARGIALETVLATPEALARPEGRELAAALRRPPLEVAAGLLEELADADSPRGWLALARLARGGAETLEPPRRGVLLYLDGIQDPGNLGALARVAEAFGAPALVLAPGCAHPNHPRALRASAGSLLRLPVAIRTEVDALDARFPRPPRWLALTAHGGTPLDHPSARPGPVVLAVGAEGPGISEAVALRADELWTLPLAGRVESLNVAVAAAVALFALRAARSD